MLAFEIVKGEFWKMSNENLKLLKYANYNLKHFEYQENSILYFLRKRQKFKIQSNEEVFYVQRYQQRKVIEMNLVSHIIGIFSQ